MSMDVRLWLACSFVCKFRTNVFVLSASRLILSSPYSSEYFESESILSSAKIDSHSFSSDAADEMAMLLNSVDAP